MKSSKVFDRCFWCNIPLFPEEKTKDHLHPIGQGGDILGETVISCHKCNHNRGLVTEYYCRLVKVNKILEWINSGYQGEYPGSYYFSFKKEEKYKRKRIKELRNLEKKKDEMLALQLKWRKLEEDKLGKCCVGDLVFSFPEANFPEEKIV